MENYKILFDNSRILEKLIPRKFDNEEQLGSYFDLNSLSSMVNIKDKITLSSINNAINIPLWDLLERGGKRWRPILGMMIGKYFNLEIENYDKAKNLYSIIGCTEILHNATLMIDDVVDKSDFRRNKPCTYKIFGEGIAINAGIGLLYYPVTIAMRTMEEHHKTKFLECYIREMAAINFGQAIDLEMNLSHKIIKESNYIDTVLCKTGVFPRLMLSQIFEICLMQDQQSKSSQLKRSLLKVMDLLSIAFQIEDDILNITENELSKNKGFLGEDIYEGKLSLMVVKAIELLNNSQSQRLREILHMRTKNPVLLNEAIKLISESGGLEYAVKFSENCVKEATDICGNLPYDTNESKEAVQELIELINYMISRKI